MRSLWRRISGSFQKAAVEAIQQGLADYVLKDAIVRLPHVLARALEMAETRRAKAQALQDLEASRAQLAALTEHLQSSIEQERAGIAREIDDIGGALSAVKFDVSWMVRNAHNATGVAEHGQAALEMLQHALGASQRIMMNLRPPVLDQGLVAAVHWPYVVILPFASVDSVIWSTPLYLYVVTLPKKSLLPALP